MKQVLFRQGRPVVEDVPAPVAGDREVLVQVHYSCISAGTELSGLKGSVKLPLYRKALQQPATIKKTLELIRTQGVAKTVARLSQIQQSEARQAEAGRPAGYSASGVVLEVGKEIPDLKPGDPVACAGAGIANHAEFICVPRNLTVRVPPGVPLDTASTVTLGSIAMQGVRRASPALGEYVAVIGLGILGQLTVQILKASGCQVVGLDVEGSRIERALALGLDKGLNPAVDQAVDGVLRFSGGHGVDTAIITASTDSSQVINEAMKMCRRKGKVIIVGAVGLNLERYDFYAKELDVLMSTSYGPGRYDERYEHLGQDYPYAYVRWTENRNMEAYLRLIEQKKIAVEPLIDRRRPIEDAAAAYEELDGAELKPMIVLLEYERDARPDRKIVIAARRADRARLNVAIVGAGAFIKGTHLPHLARLNEHFRIHAVVDKIGTNAKAVAAQYDAAYATTDVQTVWADADVDLVIIGTRHHLHARLAMEAARAGKAILLEKPMALHAEELNQLVAVLEQTRVPFMVGFNRRFSPCAVRAQQVVAGRTDPMMISYRMNAGFIPLDHWVHTEEGGGRNIGEACHIYDLFTFFTDSSVESVSASAIGPHTDQIGRNDNFAATIRYADGSVASLTYTALGHAEESKERMDIYVDGKVIRMDDYRTLDVAGAAAQGISSKVPDKGHASELVALARSIREGDGYPIPLWQLIQTTQTSFLIESEL